MLGQPEGSGGSFLNAAPGSRIALANSGASIKTSYTNEPFGNVAISDSNAIHTNPPGRENDRAGLYFTPDTTVQLLSASSFKTGSDFDGGGANLYAYIEIVRPRKSVRVG